jgi:hypothetical protein
LRGVLFCFGAIEKVRSEIKKLNFKQEREVD